jgi:hypothetical protein
VNRPIVTAKHRRHGARDLRRLPEKPQQRVGAGGHPELGRHARSGLPAEGGSDDGQRFSLPLGAAGGDLGDAGEAFGEDPPRAGRAVAEELSDLQADDDARPRPVGERARNATMDPIRGFAADRTAHVGAISDGADGQPVVRDQERVDAKRRREQAGGRGDHGRLRRQCSRTGAIVSEAREHWNGFTSSAGDPRLQRFGRRDPCTPADHAEHRRARGSDRAEQERRTDLRRRIIAPTRRRGHGRAYALMIPKTNAVRRQGQRKRVEQLGERLSAEASLDPWVCLELSEECKVGMRRWLLVRRDAETPNEHRCFLANGPEDTGVEELVRVCNTRWQIEEGFAQAKGEVGLDQYEVRTWEAWRRHATLSLLAHAYLVVLRRAAPGRTSEKGGAESGLIPLTVPEVRRLVIAMSEAAERRPFRLGWSRWRRAHQAGAARCHAARRVVREATRAGDRAAPLSVSSPAGAGLTDGEWRLVRPLLPPQKPATGRPRGARRHPLGRALESLVARDAGGVRHMGDGRPVRARTCAQMRGERPMP